MSKRSRGRGPTPPRSSGNPFADILGMAAQAVAAAPPTEDAAAGTRLELVCELLHRRCSVPFPSTHTATAPWHVKDAREFLGQLDQADDAPATTDAPLNPRDTAAERLEEAESIVRGGDLAHLATELRYQDTARTRAIADAVLGIRR